MPRKKVVTWGPLIDRFIMEKDIGGLSERTLNSYRWTLEQAVDYWGHDSDPFGIKKDDIMDVLGRWRRAKCSPTTIANRVSVFHTFFRWLSQKYEVFDPARDIERPKKDKPELRWLSSGQVEDLLLASAKQERDQIVVWLLAMTGVRRSELSAMKWRDLDADACEIRVVLGKGRKGRVVALPVMLCTLLADVRARLQEAGEYLPSHYICPKTRVVPTSAGSSAHYWRDQPMGETTAKKIIERLAAEAGIPDPSFVGPHVLRRSFATMFLEQNEEKLYELQAALGHSRIDTTAAYLAPVKRSRVRESVRRIEWFGPNEFRNQEEER